MSEYILKPCPFCGSEPMLGEVRPATRKSPPLFGITCIHCGAEMTDEIVPELIQRWNTSVTATASIDKEVMEGYGSAGHGTGTERVEDVGDS